jgi:hypothetical protein
MPNSSKWFVPFRFSNQNFSSVSHLSCTCYMLCPAHSPWSHHCNNIWQIVQILCNLCVNQVSRWQCFNMKRKKQTCLQLWMTYSWEF